MPSTDRPGQLPKIYVCVDFDGVLHSYTRWLGMNVFEGMVDGADDGMRELRSLGYILIIHTTRPDTPAIRHWLAAHKIPYHHFNENPEKVATGQDDPRKPIADIYIDDKGITFRGHWVETVEAVKRFRPWWKAA